MIGCLPLSAPSDAALHALHLRLDRLSPRVQLSRTNDAVLLLADLGRGTVQAGRRHAATLGAAIDPVPFTQIGIAATPTLVILAARRATVAAPLVVSPGAVPALLRQCPVAWLPPLAPFALVLHGLGLHTLADVAHLPAAAVGGRFGADALRAWRSLHGEEPPLTPLPHPPRLGVKRHFDGPVSDQAVLTHVLARLATQLGAALARRGMQARALALYLDGDDGRWSAGHVLERPAADGATLAPITTGLLAAAGPMGGVATLTLLVGELVPTRGEQLALFASSAAQRDAGRAALADLAARLAPGSLLCASADAPGTALADARSYLAPWGAA